MNTNKQNAEKVVNRILAMIEEKKSLPWIKPWNKAKGCIEIIDGWKTVTVQPNAWNRKGVQYKGVNTYLPVGEYITWTQCKAENGHVKKGASGWPVVYWNFVKKTEKDPETGEDKEITIPCLKYYTVFRVEDCGLEPKHNPQPVTIKFPVTHLEPVNSPDAPNVNDTAEQVISDYVRRAGNGFSVKLDGFSDRAYYSPALDYVKVPNIAQFNTGSEYYSTLFHELGHSTGHACRLNRFTGKAANAAFGSEEYSREELVAESTAATILNMLGMEEANTFRNSAAYIKSWAAHIKEDPMMYVTATTRAQAAVDLILGLEREPAPTSPDGEPTSEPEKPAEAPKAPVEPSEPVAAPVPAEKPVKARKTAKTDALEEWNARAIKEHEKLEKKFKKQQSNHETIAGFQGDDAYYFCSCYMPSVALKIYGTLQRTNWEDTQTIRCLPDIFKFAEKGATLATAKEGKVRGIDVVVLSNDKRTAVFNKKFFRHFPKNALFYLNGAKDKAAVVAIENDLSFPVIGLILPTSIAPSEVVYND